MFNGFAEKATGASHSTTGKPCQDSALFFCSNTSSSDAYAIVAVSDGHGSDKHFRSQCGSSFATSIAIEQTRKFFSLYSEQLNELSYEKILGDIIKNIIYNWRNTAEQHIKCNPFTAEENIILQQYKIGQQNQKDVDKLIATYGATLIFAAVTQRYAFAAQIGDGMCFFITNDGSSVSSPIKEDPNLGFGLTTSLCDKNAIDNFRYTFVTNSLPDAIILSTDGVVDSYSKDTFWDFNYVLYRSMAENYIATKQYLIDWLPKLSERGSRDDVAVAGIYKELTQFQINPDNSYLSSPE
jgi:serine/threonine protein phosphatase PrpC